MAAEAGGNVEITVPDQAVRHGDVTCIGYTDLPSRLPTQSSTLFANNVTKLLLSMTGVAEDGSKLPDTFGVNLEDEVVRGATVTHKKELLWPPPPPPSMAKVAAASSAAAAAPAPAEPPKVCPHRHIPTAAMARC